MKKACFMVPFNIISHQTEDIKRDHEKSLFHGPFQYHQVTKLKVLKGTMEKSFVSWYFSMSPSHQTGIYSGDPKIRFRKMKSNQINVSNIYFPIIATQRTMTFPTELKKLTGPRPIKTGQMSNYY